MLIAILFGATVCALIAFVVAEAAMLYLSFRCDTQWRQLARAPGHRTSAELDTMGMLWRRMDWLDRALEVTLWGRRSSLAAAGLVFAWGIALA